MDLQAFFEQTLFFIGELPVSAGQLSQIVLIISLMSGLGYWVLRYGLPTFYGRADTSEKLQPKSRRVILRAIVLLSAITILRTLQVDFLLWPFREEAIDSVSIRVSNVVMVLLLFSLVNLFDWLIEELINQWAFSRKATAEERGSTTFRIVSRFRSARPALLMLATLFVGNDTGINDLVLKLYGSAEDQHSITVGSVLSGLLVFFVIRFAWHIIREVILDRYYSKSEVDEGSRSALNQLLTYFAYFLGFLFMLEVAGFNLRLLWTGAAALLVGIGIGLQQTFNDLICGVIILFERSVKVGDVVDMGGPEKVGQVKKIGARTSQVETRDGILVFVPNSKLIGENVVNWSQTDRRARFHIVVGVAYGSDTSLVRKVLLEVAEAHPQVLKTPGPSVRFLDFGSSSLDFDLLIYTRNLLRIEDIRSDLRFAIDEAFRKHHVEIPFPQRDLWLRGGSGLELLQPKKEVPPAADA